MTKKIISVILVVLTLVLSQTAFTVSYANTTVDSYKNQIAELQDEEAEYQAQLDKTQDKIDSKKEYSETLTKQINNLNAQISASQAEITALNNRIAEKQAVIDEAEAKIKERLEILKQRVRSIYMAGETSDLEILLGAKDFSDLLDKYELIKTLSNYDQDLINGIQAELDTVSDEKADLVESRAELKSAQDILDTKQSKLQGLLDENEAVLSSLYEDETDLESTIKNLNAQEAEIQAKLNAYYSSQNNSNSNTNITVSPSGFTWPVPGFYGLSSPYGEDRGYSHKGIDISGGGIMGATVVAVDNGVVIAANNSCAHNWGKSGSCGCGGGYGNYVLVDHGNGKSTMYAHMSSVTVYSGATVSKGQTIGYVGSSGWSSGAHLHFETRLNGSAYNPMSEY